jgi:hypothetical protein
MSENKPQKQGNEFWVIKSDVLRWNLYCASQFGRDSPLPSAPISFECGGIENRVLLVSEPGIWKVLRQLLKTRLSRQRSRHPRRRQHTPKWRETIDSSGCGTIMELIHSHAATLRKSVMQRSEDSWRHPWAIVMHKVFVCTVVRPVDNHRKGFLLGRSGDQKWP